MLERLDWLDYFERVGHGPNAVVVRTVENSLRNRRVALDLGSGNFRDSRWLKQKGGFARVVAVDPFKEVEAYLHDGIEFYPMKMQDFKITEDLFDLTVAFNALFFISRRETEEMITRVMNGLTQEGVFIFNVLGKNDDRIQKKITYSSFTAQELDEITSPYHIVANGEANFILEDKPDGGGGRRLHMLSRTLKRIS